MQVNPWNADRPYFCSGQLDELIEKKPYQVQVEGDKHIMCPETCVLKCLVDSRRTWSLKRESTLITTSVEHPLASCILNMTI